MLYLSEYLILIQIVVRKSNGFILNLKSMVMSAENTAL